MSLVVSSIVGGQPDKESHARAHSVAVARTAGWQRRMDLRSRYEQEWECEWE